MLHVQRQHVDQKGAGRLEREYAKTSTDATHWGLNPCFWYVERGTHQLPRRKALVETPFDIPMIRARWIARQQMNTLHKRGFPNTKFLDDKPYWEGRMPRLWGGTSYQHQREKERKAMRGRR